VTTLHQQSGALVARTGSRTVYLQRLNAATRYEALLAFGWRESVAAALVVGLITITRR
jgi:hypothetical protein